MDQRGGDLRFDAVEFVVDGLERDIDGLGLGLIGGVDRGPDPADDQTHQVDDRGEEELFGVLPFGDIFEELVHNRWAEGILQDAPDHDRQRRILGKPLKDVTEEHSRRLPEETLTPCLATA